MFQFLKNLFTRNQSKSMNLDDSKDVSIDHQMSQSCAFTIIVPGHEPRKDSSLFIQTRKHLVQDLDTPCWVCGSKDNRQVHHNIVEWSLANACDWSKVKADYPDFPDWDKVDPNNPDTFVNFIDHPYQMRVLCQNHHTATNKNGQGYGVHAIPYPIWQFQKYVKSGYQFLAPNNSKDASIPEFVQDLDDMN